MEKTVIEYLEELKIKNKESVGATRRLDIIERNFKELQEAVNKYKNIEEELGIDLITLFKALKNGIVACYDNEFGGETKIFVLLTPDRLSIEYKNKCLRKGKNKFYFKDYGTTWALTKEELEGK